MQQAWASGDIKSAHTLLANLMEESEADAETWRLWGDTAAALGDLSLAAQAYERSLRLLPPNQPRWLNRYLYSWLQTGALPFEVYDRYYSVSIPPIDLEDKLIGLALEADLHYRLGNVAQATIAGKEYLNQWLGASSVAFEFLEHVQDRIWVTLARLAEESGDILATWQFLLRIDDIEVIDPNLQLVVNLLNVLLGRRFQDDTPTSQIIKQLKSVLSADFSNVHPPISGDLIASLRNTLAAVQTGDDGLSLLARSVMLRRTNVLARWLYVEELHRRRKRVGHMLATEAYLWVTTHPGKYDRPIGHFLTRPPGDRVPRFSFVALGGGGYVGGSSYLVDLNGTKLLLDVGLNVGTSLTSSYRRFKHNLSQSGIVNGLDELDAVLVSHAHLDHIGLLPALYTDPDLPRVRISSGSRPRIPFYASEATRDIARVMLEDTGRLATTLEANPLYTSSDVAETIDGLDYPKDGRLHLFRDLGQVELLESGHILGARMILLEKDGLRVLYTGDFNTRSQLTLSACAPLKGLRPDVLIMESTYGYSVDDWTLPRSFQERAFIAHLDRVLRRGGVVLLPTFAVGRSQEMLGVVAKHACQNRDLSYGIYLDGLSLAVTDCYDKFTTQLPERYLELRSWINHRLIKVSDDANRESLIREQVLNRPNVVIASSGMLKRGSVSYQYAMHIADNPENAIFYTGYLAADSEAVAFLNGDANDLDNTGIDVKCEQRRFYFSTHAPKADLFQFVLDVQPRAVILVHGDASRKTQVPGNLYERLRRLEQESDSFRVFLGQDGRRIEYKEGRFFQR